MRKKDEFCFYFPSFDNARLSKSQKGGSLIVISMGSEEQKPCESTEVKKPSDWKEEEKGKEIAGVVVVSGASEPLKPSWFTPKRYFSLYPFSVGEWVWN